jgi:tetratricopeptide (TPR) repeat protein
MPAPAAPAMQASAPPSSGQPEAPALDVRRAADLEQQAKARPADASVRADLGNLYYDAQRFDLAIPWYEGSLQLNPKDVDVSTDLAVAYYYVNRVDDALAQIDRSLAVDPTHVKTLLNQGIIRAFGREDLDGATRSWQRVVELAPDSPEGRSARQALEGLKSHPPGAPAAGGGSEEPERP